MAPPPTTRSSGLRASFSENLNGTSSEQIFRGGDLMDLEREGREIAEGIGALDLWHQSAVMISHSFVE